MQPLGLIKRRTIAVYCRQESRQGSFIPIIKSSGDQIKAKCQNGWITTTDQQRPKKQTDGSNNNKEQFFLGKLNTIWNI